MAPQYKRRELIVLLMMLGGCTTSLLPDTSDPADLSGEESRTSVLPSNSLYSESSSSSSGWVTARQPRKSDWQQPSPNSFRTSAGRYSTGSRQHSGNSFEYTTNNNIEQAIDSLRADEMHFSTPSSPDIIIHPAGHHSWQTNPPPKTEPEFTNEFLFGKEFMEKVKREDEDNPASVSLRNSLMHSNSNKHLENPHHGSRNEPTGWFFEPKLDPIKNNSAQTMLLETEKRATKNKPQSNSGPKSQEKHEPGLTVIDSSQMKHHDGYQFSHEKTFYRKPEEAGEGYNKIEHMKINDAYFPEKSHDHTIYENHKPSQHQGSSFEDSGTSINNGSPQTHYPSQNAHFPHFHTHSTSTDYKDDIVSKDERNINPIHRNYYHKYIHPRDNSLRDADPELSLSPTRIYANDLRYSQADHSKTNKTGLMFHYDNDGPENSIHPAVEGHNKIPSSDNTWENKGDIIQSGDLALPYSSAYLRNSNHYGTTPSTDEVVTNDLSQFPQGNFIGQTNDYRPNNYDYFEENNTPSRSNESQISSNGQLSAIEDAFAYSKHTPVTNLYHHPNRKQTFNYMEKTKDTNKDFIRHVNQLYGNGLNEMAPDDMQGHAHSSQDSYMTHHLGAIRKMTDEMKIRAAYNELTKQRFHGESMLKPNGVVYHNSARGNEKTLRDETSEHLSVMSSNSPYMAHPVYASVNGAIRDSNNGQSSVTSSVDVHNPVLYNGGAANTYVTPRKTENIRSNLAVNGLKFKQPTQMHSFQHNRAAQLNMPRQKPRFMLPHLDTRFRHQQPRSTLVRGRLNSRPQSSDVPHKQSQWHHHHQHHLPQQYQMVSQRHPAINNRVIPHTPTYHAAASRSVY